MRGEFPSHPHWALVLTCEHASKEVPESFRKCFDPEQLSSHEGWDEGALQLAERVQDLTGVALHRGTHSRLLVDLNRSEESPGLHAPPIRALPEATREELVEEHHRPYRMRVLEAVEAALSPRQRVLHLSIHTFTPVLEGRVREVDVGVLFDPSAAVESDLAHELMERLSTALPEARVRPNEPYLGTADGLTTSLRGRFPDHLYAGIELEVTQAWVGRSDFDERARRIAQAVAASIGASPLPSP